MKANKALLLSILAFAYCAGATPVSVDTARLAAGSWALSDASLGVPHGTTVGDATPYDVDGTVGFYSISLDGGGTVFLAADDEIDPILAFTAATNVDLTGESPLLNLLTRDVRMRRGLLEAPQAKASSSALLAASGTSASSAWAAGVSAEGERAKKLWEAFTSAAAASPEKPSGGRVLLGATASPRETLASSDIRVEPILTTKWSQTTDKAGRKCYNYYTPNNYPCGCVATATGQILNRWKYPTEELPQFSNSCVVDNVTTTLDSSGPPRVYNWDAMVDRPGLSTSEASRQAIGALLSDLGISFGADYSEEGTGAFEWDVPRPVREHFKYASAYTYSGRTALALHTAPVRQRAILANLDAKRPVELYIMSNRAGGHAVVADGYGYVTIAGEEVEFTHVNMGWAGTDDMWYNLPVVQTKEAGSQGGQTGGYTFESLSGVTFNIHPTETGDLLTGRIIDDGDPVEGATVSVYAVGGTDPIASTTSDARGIYSFTLPGGTSYDVRASLTEGSKTKTGSADDVFLKATKVTAADYTTYKDDDIGNSWGNDIDIAIPYVRVVAGDETSLYNNLDAALNVAAEMDDPVVEVFGPVKLRKPVTITTNMTIRVVADSTSEYPTFEDCPVLVEESAITVNGWALQIAGGVRVDFVDLGFVSKSGAALPFEHLNVLSGGVLAVAGKIGVGTVKIQDETGFVLAGVFEPVGAGLLIAYGDAEDQVRFKRFGSYECSEADAASCASLIVNRLDEELMGAVGEDGSLVWDRVAVSPTIALAYAESASIPRTYYRSLDKLFADYVNGADVVILKDCPADSFQDPVVVSTDMTLKSADGVTATITASNGTSFTLVDGASLVVSNLVLTNTGSSESLFTVDHGSSLELASGGEISGLTLGASASAVRVKDGTFTMKEGAVIRDCKQGGNQNGGGAGVYLEGEGCVFDLTGGQITGCSVTSGNGGGVYAALSAEVNVSGPVLVVGNSSTAANDDIYCAYGASLTLAGPLVDGSSIGVWATSREKKGKVFATVADGISAADAEASAAAFFNDTAINNPAKNNAMAAEVVAAGLAWRAVELPLAVPEALGIAKLTTNGVTVCYQNLKDAFQIAAKGPTTITLLKDAVLSNDVSVVTAVVLDGAGFTLSRSSDYTVSVSADASLSVANALVSCGGRRSGKCFFYVNCGELTLDPGTVVSGFYGESEKTVAPIDVWGGWLTMNPGSAIVDCTNRYAGASGAARSAGAVVVTSYSNATEVVEGGIRLNGGTVRGCMGGHAGGIYVGNGATVAVRGPVRVTGNVTTTREDSNLVVQDRSSLVLVERLDGRVGFTEGFQADTDVVGYVEESYADTTTASNLVVSARRFRRDATGEKGAIVTNDTATLIVWESAVGEDGQYTRTLDDGTEEVYALVDVPVDDDVEEPVGVVVECEPFEFTAIEALPGGKWRLTLKPGTEFCVYTLKTSDDLKQWEPVGDPRTLSAEDFLNEDREFVFEPDSSDAKRFWMVEGADGIK